MKKYLQFGIFTKDCPKNLLIKVEKIERQKNQRDYIIKIFEIIKKEFNPRKHKMTTTND